MTMALHWSALIITYFYPMRILVRRKLSIQRMYLYLISFLISGILAIQVSNANAVSTVLGVVQYVLLFLANYFVWIVLLDYIYGALWALQQKDRSLVKRIIEAVCSFTLLLLVHLIITNIIYYSYRLAVGNVVLTEVWTDFSPFILPSLLSRLIDLVVILLIIKAVEAYALIQQQKLEVISLKNELTRSQLEALRSQLDPHFLFNALHTLNTLIGYEDDKAKNMILKITQLMRTMLSRKDEQLITFAEELEYFKNYLDIEQERFHDRLDVQIDVHHSTLTFKVPALVLQPLIENAFKHGISRIGGKGNIHLKAYLEDGELHVRMTNSIPKNEDVKAVHSTKLGLANLKHRLQLFFKEQHRFTAAKKDGYFEVTLALKKASL